MHEMEKRHVGDSILINDRLSDDYRSKLAKIFSENSYTKHITIIDFRYVILSIDSHEKISNDYKNLLKSLLEEHYVIKK